MDSSAITWVLGLPILGFLIQAFFGKTIVDAMGPAKGKRLLGALAVTPIAAAFAIGLGITQKLYSEGHEGGHGGHVVSLFSWIDLASLKVPFELIVDPLSMTMVLIITGIGALIHLYATGYMAEEKDYPRFFTYLNLFVASMLILVLGNNLALLFIGWEGVGLCSYLLIGFWYKDLANSKAANKAFIVNRIGDWGLTLGMFLIVAFLGANWSRLPIQDGRLLSYDVILPALETLLKENVPMATAIGLLLFVGACGKSAQFPLYLWLPDAMAGPTPVSALIHAATMVTSGVVLLNRMHVVFEISPIASGVVCAVGAFTALFAALVAFGQTDIKKVLAYSTVSQLGFMFVGAGSGAYWTGMFHVTTHAFFKALLFLGSGAVIHAMAHNQDMRNYGGLLKYLPKTGWTMIIGWLAIAGVALPIAVGTAPGLGFAGFYSKEAIIGAALANHHATINGMNLSVISGWTALFVAFLTAMYMTRLTFLTFFGKEERWRSIPAHAEHGHDDHAHQADHAEHGHDDHHHGPDEHGFFFTEEEMAAQPHEHEHHHELDGTHTPHEVPPSMWIPLAALAVLSVAGGFLLYNNHFFEHFLYPNDLPVLGKVEYHPHGLPLDLLWLSIIAAFGGILAGALVYAKGLPKKEGFDESKWNPFRRLAGEQFLYDKSMMGGAVDGGRELGVGIWKGIDSWLIDGTVNGLAKVAGGLGTGFKAIQTGYIRLYALMMLLGGVGLVGWFVYQASQLGGGR